MENLVIIHKDVIPIPKIQEVTMANESRSIEVFKQTVKNIFSFLKQTTRLDDLFTKSIPLAENMGFLLPLCELHISDTILIAQLAKWREENAFAFPSQFSVTISGTTSWLRSKILDSEDRLLFLVTDRHGRAVGHLGYANSINDQGKMEIDNVVRGVKDAPPGIMTNAMKAILNWAEDVIGPREIFLRVLCGNDHAISFYRKLGFRDDVFIPLRKHIEGSVISYCPLVEGDPSQPDKQFLRMVYDPQRVVDNSQLILTAGPSISALECSYVMDAVRYGWNFNWNNYIKRFETAFSKYMGIKYALSTSSCTGALHLALAALGIGPGDEVIVPDITWVATANAVLYVGGTPIFADIEPDSWCLDPHSFKSLITKRTKAVIPVHLYGHPSRMDEIMEIARKHHLYVLEDAAPSIGAECNGQKIGTFGDYAAFSFQGAKVAVTGEGGMLITNDDELFKRAYSIWNQGRIPGTFWIQNKGLKYKMSNVQAAIGLGQIERIDELIEAKRRIFSWYAEGLDSVSRIQLNRETPWARSIYWMTSLILDAHSNIKRDDLREELKKHNIDTRVVFPSISQYPIWPKPQPAQPVAWHVSNQAVNLPSGVCLKREQVNYICRCIRKIMG